MASNRQIKYDWPGHVFVLDITQCTQLIPDPSTGGLVCETRYIQQMVLNTYLYKFNPRRYLLGALDWMHTQLHLL